MLPINDFNFVVAGIATFAATVGYAYTRRLSGSLSGSSDQSRDDASVKASQSQSTEDDSFMITEKSIGLISASTVTDVELMSLHGKENLKRKIPHDGFEEPEKPVKTELGYPDNLAHIYPAPNKRRKTPSINDEKTTAPAVELDSMKPQVSTEVTQSPLNIEDPDPPVIATTPAPEPPHTPSPVAEAPSPAPAPAPPSPTIPFVIQPILRQLPTPVIPLPPATPKLSESSIGFAAFAGSASPFSSLATKDTTPKPGHSIWSSSKSDLTLHQNEETQLDDAPNDDSFKPKTLRSIDGNALEETKPAATLPTTKYKHFTGEEDEDVEMELKGVKLYVKRGEKPFGDGIMGHLKLLAHRATLEERLLFRREPLRKVSMNVRVQPTVRCAFIPEENALKLILKESVEPPTDSKETDVKQDLVIYVLKPGRLCPKQDFRDFAVTLVENSHFKAPSALSESP